MPDTMIEIDVEDLMGLMSFEKPVLCGPVTAGALCDISDDVLVIESFTSTGIVMPVVYGVGVLAEIDIEPVGMSYERPVVWGAVSAGSCTEIKIGSLPVLPGDTMALIDFGEKIQCVQFIDNSRGLYDTLSFNFGDGSPIVSELPQTHQYDLYSVGEPFTVDCTLTISSNVQTNYNIKTDSITKIINLL